MSRRRPAPEPEPELRSAEPPAKRRGPIRRALCAAIPPFRELAQTWRSGALALVSVVLLALCYPPFGAWPLAFLALVPWLWGLRRVSPAAAFWWSWLFGAAHFATVYYWLHTLSRFNPAIYAGIPLLCLWMGLFIAIQGAGILAIAKRTDPWRGLGFAVLWWAGWEWFRSVGAYGVPYALLGHAVHGFTPLVQVVSIGGVPLLSSLVLAVNLCAMEATALALKRFFDIGVALRAGLVIAAVIGASVWGSFVVRGIEAREQDASLEMRVAVLQPNVLQDDKFASYAIPGFDSMTPVQQLEAYRAMLAMQERLTRETLAIIGALPAESFDLVVTPESAFTENDFDSNRELARALREQAEELGAVLLVGGSDIVYRNTEGEYVDDPGQADMSTGEPQTDLYNAVFAVRPGGEGLIDVAEYRKAHLMPFGESLPYLDKIPFLLDQVVQIAPFLSGDDDQPPIWIPVHPSTDDPNAQPTPVRVGVTICFEDMFPYLHRRMARAKAQAIVNVTNDAWYDPSLGSTFHALHVRFRSAEVRLPMIRCTNSGVTFISDAAGRVVEKLPVREQGVLNAKVAVPTDPSRTLYAMLGDWWGMLAWFAGIAVVWVSTRRRRSGDPAAA